MVPPSIRTTFPDMRAAVGICSRKETPGKCSTWNCRRSSAPSLFEPSCVSLWRFLNFPLTQASKELHWQRVKALVTILFSLALVLSHWPAFASPVKQLCQSETACGCGDSACCVKSADPAPAPVAPLPSADNSRTQWVAVLQAVLHFVGTQPESVGPRAPLPAPPAPADVPLYVWNCSYLI